LKIAVVMNYDSYERFGYTDPRDDLDYLEFEYELYTEYNIEGLFADIHKHSCFLLASNALHHSMIQLTEVPTILFVKK
jgi:membrane-bound lytic murein transglycosylase MltF